MGHPLSAAGCSPATRHALDEDEVPEERTCFRQQRLIAALDAQRARQQPPSPAGIDHPARLPTQRPLIEQCSDRPIFIALLDRLNLGTFEQLDTGCDGLLTKPLFDVRAQPMRIAEFITCAGRYYQGVFVRGCLMKMLRWSVTVVTESTLLACA